MQEPLIIIYLFLTFCVCEVTKENCTKMYFDIYIIYV